MSFVPQWAEIYEKNTLGQPSQRLNPELYATPLSAMQFLDEIKSLNPKLVMQDPWPVNHAGPWYFTQQVPYFSLPSGYSENIGEYQIWWTRVPADEATALRYCITEILADEAAWQVAQNGQ